MFYEQCFPFLQQNLGKQSSLPLPICDTTDTFFTLPSHSQLPQQSSAPAQSFHQHSDFLQHNDSAQHQTLQENNPVQHLPSSDTIFNLGSPPEVTRHQLIFKIMFALTHKLVGVSWSLSLQLIIPV